MEAGKLQNVLADQVCGVLAPPTLGVVGPLRQAGLWKATSLDQMQQGLIGSHAAVGTPLPHRHRVEVQMQVATGQRLARLAEGVHPRAAGASRAWPTGRASITPLSQAFQSAILWISSNTSRPVCRHIPVEVLG